MLVDAVSRRTPGRALDLACGRGRNSIHLASLGWHVLAVDYSEVALADLQSKALDNIEVVRADLEAGEFHIPPASYDLIVDCCFLYRPLFPAIRSGMRAGGLFVGVFPLEGINPKFLMRRGEILTHFQGWRVLHHNEENTRAELVAEKPDH